ncbi:hypothetical protein WR25_21001 [Diploscapter pachys]|uniref:Helix-hairpin-helix DNA-binding motif class 1 domain-containing protein n=2 Tax=cellular organisms TaxID=131567 RepID=A0A2A2K769_9BILA|nr:hypothetical protein WR25_21001 [Diploscapter pachys]
MIILGLDPGLGTTGWGVIHADGNRLRHIANGQIKTDPSMPLPRRLSNLHAALVDVILAERPDGAAVEEGRLDSTGIDHAVIDVGGVGYLVGASARTLAAIGPVGEAAMLHTEMLVAEDSIRLVGFARAEERDWFRLLTGVQGVGSRVALAILSALDTQEIARAVSAQDKAMVARANGVGPKLAERIVRELKDKVGTVALGPAAAAQVVPVGASADAVSALLNLGFRPAEAANAVGAAEEDLGPGATLDALVRLALHGALMAWIEQRVEAGGYADVSAYLCHLIRQDLQANGFALPAPDQDDVSEQTGATLSSTV